MHSADFLHANNASIGYSLVNWNITVAGAIAMGAHRTSLSEDATVSAAALALDIIVANGTIIRVEKDEESEDWLAASVSLGLLGVIARVQLRVLPEFKIQANQQMSVLIFLGSSPRSSSLELYSLYVTIPGRHADRSRVL